MLLTKQLDGEPAVVNLNKALWEKGDFTQIAALMRESGAAVVESLGLKPPLRALDLGSGDGRIVIDVKDAAKPCNGMATVMR